MGWRWLTVVDDGRWWWIMVDGVWWWLMLVNGGCWWVDDGRWWFSISNSNKNRKQGPVHLSGWELWAELQLQFLFLLLSLSLWTEFFINSLLGWDCHAWSATGGALGCFDGHGQYWSVLVTGYGILKHGILYWSLITSMIMKATIRHLLSVSLP